MFHNNDHQLICMILDEGEGGLCWFMIIGPQILLATHSVEQCSFHLTSRGPQSTLCPSTLAEINIWVQVVLNSFKNILSLGCIREIPEWRVNMFDRRFKASHQSEGFRNIEVSRSKCLGIWKSWTLIISCLQSLLSAFTYNLRPLPMIIWVCGAKYDILGRRF